jgi:hypothetical protein
MIARMVICLIVNVIVPMIAIGAYKGRKMLQTKAMEEAPGSPTA